MHCASCEVLIERKFKKVRGVEKVRVNHATGQAQLYCSREPDLQELQNQIKADGYTVKPVNSYNPSTIETKSGKRNYMEAGAVFLLLLGIYLLLKQFDFLPKNFGISDQMGYGLVFVIGLVAALSTCLAVTGGLLLAMAGKYQQANPHLSGREKFKPHLYFNVGRVFSYTFFGGVIGAFGSIISLSPRMNGILTILASVVMILLGFQLLKIFPWLKQFQPKMPKFLAHRIHNLSEQKTKKAAFFLGAGTFFLPCGFTQALQLYVLSKGDMLTGALTMLVFSLGTLPALLSLSFMSSFFKGSFQKYFLKFTGAAVIMLGFFNINNGLVLSGLNPSLGFRDPASQSQQQATDSNVKRIGDKQIVRMKVNGLEYSPAVFRVEAGVPVEWQIDGTKAQGCAQVISVPKLDLVKYLSPKGITTINFTPEKEGEIKFSCTMGMTTPGAKFIVLPPNGSGAASKTKDEWVSQEKTDCNANISDCLKEQDITVQVSNERGYFPEEVTAQAGLPVKLTVDSQVELGGCMSVLVIPEYDVTFPVKKGKSQVTFTPTKKGTLDVTCSMGIPMFQIVVK